MQAYATAEIAPSVALRVVDDRPARHARPDEHVTPRDAILDELLGHLADLVAEKVAARLTTPRHESDAWFDTRRAAEYLGIHRDRLRRLVAEGAIPAEQENAGASCTSVARLSMRGGVPAQLRSFRCGMRAMADSSSAPRRVRVERGIYRRPTGVLEIAFKDERGVCAGAR
jgi:hypothetical protein